MRLIKMRHDEPNLFHPLRKCKPCSFTIQSDQWHGRQAHTVLGTVRGPPLSRQDNKWEAEEGEREIREAPYLTHPVVFRNQVSDPACYPLHRLTPLIPSCKSLWSIKVSRI